jgi:hypothetical protein
MRPEKSQLIGFFSLIYHWNEANKLAFYAAFNVA